MSSQPGQPPLKIAPPPVPADIGIVAALPIEINPFLGRLAKVRKYSTGRHTIHEGELAGKLIAVIVTGPGRKAARRGSELLLSGHRPNWMISAGFGGALDPELKRNAVVFGRELIDPEGSRINLDFNLNSDASQDSWRAGNIVTVDAIVRTALEKAQLRELTGADVVDMETSAVATVCAERNVRMVALRIISDEAHLDLPAEIVSILGRTGGYRVGAALGAIWRRPSSVKDLWSLREHAVAAADQLSKVLLGVVAHLP